MSVAVVAVANAAVIVTNAASAAALLQLARACLLLLHDLPAHHALPV